MPYKVEERDGKCLVINTDTGEMKEDHGTDCDKAHRQVRLLHEIERKAGEDGE